MNKIIVSVVIVILLIGTLTMAQSPDGFPTSTNTFDMPSDMCYSVIDQSPMVVSAVHSENGYTFSYINTFGNVISNTWTYNGFSANWWLKDTITAKGYIAPKCFGG